MPCDVGLNTKCFAERSHMATDFVLDHFFFDVFLSSLRPLYTNHRLLYQDRREPCSIAGAHCGAIALKFAATPRVTVLNTERMHRVHSDSRALPPQAGIAASGELCLKRSR